MLAYPSSLSLVCLAQAYSAAIVIGPDNFNVGLGNERTNGKQVNKPSPRFEVSEGGGG